MTEIIVVLDRSGSMRGKEEDVIGGFNSFIKEQKQKPGEARLTLVLFDHHYEIIHDRLDLNKVSELSRDIYFTRGMTALYDAIGEAITTCDEAERGIVLIFTDGFENASCEYSKITIKRLIQKKEEEGWEVIFIGADINAMEEGAAIGIRQTNIMQTNTTSAGLAASAVYMSSRATEYRSTDDSNG